MVLHLYGDPWTVCTKRVALILHEKQVPFDFHPINFRKGEHKDPIHVAHQPFGLVPYIDDDGFVLFESRAIGRYLAMKYSDQGTPLMPPISDVQKMAVFEQTASIELTSFDRYAGRAGIEKLVNPRKHLPIREEVVEEALLILDTKLEVYDEILGRQRYLGGDELSLADLFHIPWGAYLKLAGSDIMESKLNVARWWRDITSRPSWLAVEHDIQSVLEYGKSIVR